VGPAGATTLAETVVTVAAGVGAAAGGWATGADIAAGIREYGEQFLSWNCALDFGKLGLDFFTKGLEALSTRAPSGTASMTSVRISRATSTTTGPSPF
jgi:hypothetical protein